VQNLSAISPRNQKLKMTFEIFEAKPLLAIDQIEISRLRRIYQTESLAINLSRPTTGTPQKNEKFRNLIVSEILKFAPRNTSRRKSLRRFWRFVPNSFKLTILARNGWISDTGERFAISSSFNIDRGFGIRTSDSPLVSVVIPVHNKYHLTLQCLRALQNNSDITPYEIIVVNDASSDWTKSALSNIRGIRVINVVGNLGYLRATNLGISETRGKYVALLNNDTIPISGWLDRLVSELESDSKIGIAGAKLLYPNMQVQELGSQIFSDGSGWNLGKYADHFSPEHSFTREVDYVSAAAILVRSDLLAKTNGFDELYIPAYYEDVDLAMQARKNGLKVVAVHDSFVIHIEGGSHGADTNQGVKQFQLVNKSKFIEKWRDELVHHWDSNVGPRLESKRNSKGIALIYDSQIPQGLRDAGSQRAMQIVKELSDLGFHVIYFSPDQSVSIIDVIQFRDKGIEIHTNHEVLIASLGNRADRIRGIWIQRISVASSFFDMIHRKFPNIPIIFDTIDLVSSRVRKENLDGIQSEMTLSEATRLEDKFTSYSSITLTVSEDEKRQLQLRVPSAKIESLWMSYETVKNSTYKSALTKSGLFVGNFRHTPNKVSITWFIREVLPKIREKHNDFVLNVIGTGLSPNEIADLSSDDVQFLGFVDDLGPAYESAKVVVIPLQYGAGIKGKTCEALSHSSVVVSTTFGVEGLSVTDGVEFLLADNADVFAHQVNRVLLDEELRKELSQAALNYSFANLSRDSFSSKVKNIARIFE
jgi:GT2 family glycosyltransferase/glycosyltransferase involved in cell wall biosynthesis